MQKHTDYVNCCSEMIRTILFREGSLKEALAQSAETCFTNFPMNDIPYGDEERCLKILDILTYHGKTSISETVYSMSDLQVREIVEMIFHLNIDLILDEAMEKVDNLWKTTYLRSMKFHN